jgi:GTP-binding protein
LVKKTLAILGRPNVGKSTLFNRLVGSRKSIVSPVEGVTRDRVYSSFDWVGHDFDIIDTGGFLPKEKDIMNRHIQAQARIAINEADLIIFLVDGRSEITSSDRILADMVIRSQKSSILVVNKIDSLDQIDQINDFFQLGLGDPIPISATHGRNIGDMLDVVLEKLPDNKTQSDDNKSDVDLALIGMPNVGKSSLMNALLNEDKSIVTDIAGTTRDSIDSYITYFGKTIRLIDTAGLRKRTKVTDEIEFYSVVRTNKVIAECNVAAIMIDANKGFDKQDKDIIRAIIKLGKGLIIVINKWDLIEKDDLTMKRMIEDINYEFSSTRHYPILFISVKNNLRLQSILDCAVKVHNRLISKVPTPLLNEIIQKIINSNPPPAVKGKHLKVKYSAQTRHSPPIFALFMNYPDLVPISYKRYIENQLRKELDLEGVPIKISFRKK